jgi:hypothetical protein
MLRIGREIRSIAIVLQGMLLLVEMLRMARETCSSVIVLQGVLLLVGVL